MMQDQEMAMDAKRILLVDDDPFILGFLSKILSDEGYDMVQCEDGDSAISMLDSQAFDLVITDICMPGKNGIELANYVKQKGFDSPVLAISSNFVPSDSDDEDDVRGLTSYFADDTLAKPIAKGDLLRSVENLLSNSDMIGLYG